MDHRQAKLVHKHLSLFFDEEKGVYAAGWNDGRVAKACGVTAGQVAAVRREAYAPLAEDPELVKLREVAADLQKRFAMVTELAAACEAECRDLTERLRLKFEGAGR